MFLILCMHFVVAYQARITYSEIGSYRRETTFFWLLSQISVDII